MIPCAAWFRRAASSQSGATSIEYALIAALIALAILVGVRALGANITLYYNGIAANLT